MSKMLSMYTAWSATPRTTSHRSRRRVEVDGECGCGRGRPAMAAGGGAPAEPWMLIAEAVDLGSFGGKGTEREGVVGLTD